MKILIVEDSYATQDALELLLKEKYKDTDILIIESGEEFLSKLPDMDVSELDLVLLDQTLDRVNFDAPQGKQVFEKLVEKDPSIKERIFSISDNKSSVDYIPENRIIGKPMDITDLSSEEYLRIGGRFMKKLPDFNEREIVIK